MPVEVTKLTEAAYNGAIHLVPSGIYVPEGSMWWTLNTGTRPHSIVAVDCRKDNSSPVYLAPVPPEDLAINGIVKAHRVEKHITGPHEPLAVLKENEALFVRYRDKRCRNALVIFRNITNNLALPTYN